MSGKPASHQVWAQRVSEWRESGESAAVFAAKRGYSMSSLFRWSRRLDPKPKTRFLQLVPKAMVPAEQKASSELVVEVGLARVRIGTGFDEGLLANVVRVLSQRGER